MGEIADMVLDGTLCELCGVAMGDQQSPGYPRWCDECTAMSESDETQDSDDYEKQ